MITPITLGLHSFIQSQGRLLGDAKDAVHDLIELSVVGRRSHVLAEELERPCVHLGHECDACEQHTNAASE